MLVLAAVGVVLAGCGSDSPTAATANSSPDAAVSPQDAGLPLGTAKLSADQQAAATTFATNWVAQLVTANPALAGIVGAGRSPRCTRTTPTDRSGPGRSSTCRR